MEVKTVGLASDHAGFPMKQFVLQYLEKKGYPVKDYGTYSDESVDYPDFAHALAEGIENGDVYPGIGICGSGEGMAMTLNKHQGVRAGLAWNKDIAQLIRQHNDANVIVKMMYESHGGLCIIFLFIIPSRNSSCCQTFFTSLLSTHNIIMTIAYTPSKSCAKSWNL